MRNSIKIAENPPGGAVACRCQKKDLKTAKGDVQDNARGEMVASADQKVCAMSRKVLWNTSLAKAE